MHRGLHHPRLHWRLLRVPPKTACREHRRAVAVSRRLGPLEMHHRIDACKAVRMPRVGVVAAPRARARAGGGVRVRACVRGCV